MSDLSISSFPPSQAPAALRARLERVQTWLFDLDNTLYPASCSLFPQIDARMKAYIAQTLGLSLDDAFVLQKKYYRDYGTSLRGLMLCHGIEPDQYLAYVHDIDHSVLPHDPALRPALQALPGRRYIFTNGSRRHAEAVLEHLGLDDLFTDIFDVRAADYVPKPQVETYHKMLAAFAVQPQDCAFFEDSHLNLVPAAELGMVTVLVRNGPDHGPLALTAETDLSHCDFITDDVARFCQGVGA